MNFSGWRNRLYNFTDQELGPLLHWLRLPAFISWLAISFGVGIAYELPLRWRTAATGQLLHSWTLPALLLLLALTGILIRRQGFRFAAFLLFAIILCVARRGHQVAVFEALLLGTQNATPIEVVGKVTTSPLPYYENYHFLLRVDSASGSAAALRGLTINCIAPHAPPQYRSVKVEGVFAAPRPRRNPFEYDEFRAMMGQGIWGTLQAQQCTAVTTIGAPGLIERIAEAFRKVSLAALDRIEDFDNRALLQASFLGDTDYLSPYVKNIFRRSGTYHLIAISGLNTAILTAAVIFFLQLFRLNRPVVHLLCLIVLWAYLPFVGMIPSLFRATIMATALIATLLFQKKNYGMQTLGLAGTAWLVLSPESLFDPGYQLSFAATVGLLVLFPVLNRYSFKPRKKILRKPVEFFFTSLYISLASFLVTAPVLLYHFGTLSYVSLLANLVAVAAMTLAMWAFFAGLLLQMVLPFAAGIPLWAAERFMDLVVGTAAVAGSFPWSQGSYATPSIELMALFVLFLAGMAIVRPERLKTFMAATLVAAVMLVPADLMVRRALRTLEVVRFALPKGEICGVRWPDNRIWSANRSLPQQVVFHVLPWVRHAGKARVDALYVPGFGENAVKEAAAKLGRPAPAAITGFPSIKHIAQLDDDAADDSVVSVYRPGISGCSCTIVAILHGTRVAIGGRGFDTTLSMSEKGGDAQSATVMLPGGHGISVREVMEPDNPLR